MIKNPSQIADEISEHMQSVMSDFFFCGMDKDGNRIYGLKLGLNQRMPARERHDKYIGLLGQIQDSKDCLKQLWQEWVFNESQQQSNQTKPDWQEPPTDDGDLTT